MKLSGYNRLPLVGVSWTRPSTTTVGRVIAMAHLYSYVHDETRFNSSTEILQDSPEKWSKSG